MRRPLVNRTLGLALACLVAFSMGHRPTSRAGQVPPAAVSATVLGCDFVGPADALEKGPVVHLPARPMTPEATRLWLKLQDKVDMPFAKETSLDEVMKYVRSNTVDKVHFPDGIPIYVDPIGLQDADKTTASTVTLELKGIPMATTLELVLKQLGLKYHVQKDGILLITSSSSEDSPPDAESLILDNLAALRAEVKALREEVRMSRGHAASGPAQDPPAPRPTGGIGGGFR